MGSHAVFVCVCVAYASPPVQTLQSSMQRLQQQARSDAAEKHELQRELQAVQRARESEELRLTQAIEHVRAGPCPLQVLHSQWPTITPSWQAKRRHAETRELLQAEIRQLRDANTELSGRCAAVAALRYAARP